jgi:hypothetical protein
MEPIVTINIRDFVPSSQKYLKGYGKAVALGFGDVARTARDSVRKRTRSVFELNSDYIINGIKSIPDTPAQIAAASKAVEKYGDINAAVYLRGSNDRKKSLNFMVNHETGEDKKSVDGSLAIPASDIQNYSYRTVRGAVKARYKPAKLLEKYNVSNGKKCGPNAGRSSGTPFVIRGKSGTLLIARRKGKNKTLQFMYSFKKRANIKAEWNFEETVISSVKQNYVARIGKQIQSIRV